MFGREMLCTEEEVFYILHTSMLSPDLPLQETLQLPFSTSSLSIPASFHLQYRVNEI